MDKTCLHSFWNKFCQILLSLKNLAFKTLSTKPRVIIFAAILVLVLILVPALFSRKEPADEAAQTATDAQSTVTEPATEPAPAEIQPVGIPATMGTIIVDNLAICKDAGVVVDIEEYYNNGDRVEIHEEKTVNGKIWAYTGKGWVDRNCVRMDDIPPSNISTNPDGTEIVSNGSHAVLGYGVVDLNALNVRVGPGTDYSKVKEIHQGVRYAYYEAIDEWVRIGDGWVSTEYFYIEGTTAEDATAGIITTNDLNVRTGPDTSFKRVRQYMEDDSVQILAVVNGWGYTEEGWISMIYVKLPDPVYTTGSATVTVGLNIREEPDAASAKLDVYKEGDRVTITEVKDDWGKTDKGWINLNYVKYD